MDHRGNQQQGHSYQNRGSRRDPRDSRFSRGNENSEEGNDASGPEALYGVNPAFEVLHSGRRKIHRVFVNLKQKDAPRLRKLADQCQRAGVPVTHVDKGELFRICNSTEHQGVVVQADKYPYSPLAGMFKSSRLLLIDNIEDPQNLGAILRSAEIFGFRQVLISKKGVPEIYPSVVKASAGATEHLDINKTQTAIHYMNAARQEGFHVVALDGNGTIPLENLPVGTLKKLLLIIGGEDKGVGQFILNEADSVVRIAQVGRINSLNASVAAGIALHWIATNVKVE